MARPIQSRTRIQIRQSIGYNLKDVIVSTASGNGSTTTLVDTAGLALGGTDEYKGRQLYMTTGTAGNIGDYSVVTGHNATTKTLTVAPAFASATASADGYELWRVFRVEEVNDAIDDAVMDATDSCLQPKQTATTFTEWDSEEYNCLSDFVGVHKVEYVSSIGTSETIHDCDTAWTGATNVTVSVDTEMKRQGSGCNKFVVSGDVAASANLATATISSTDFSGYDTIEAWIYSTIAFSAAQIEFMLDDTAACASPLEAISLPAIVAETWTRVQLTLANPYSDTAIISIGLRHASGVDVGACTIYLDYVTALKGSSRVYNTMPSEYWSIVRGTTNYLKLTPEGHSTTDDNTLLRITGYGIPGLLDTDSETAEIDPGWIIAHATAQLMTSHAKSPQLDIDGREGLGDRWQAKANQRFPRVTTSTLPNTRWTT